MAFYKERGHTILPAAPIVPENDPTTLFTSSGMQPLVPYLLGQPHPEGVRLADAQTSFRAGDIEEVGDNRHTTYFEMLGNWSLGDYFKQEQLPWVFEFLTKQVGLDPAKLYVTVFDGAEDIGVPRDEEAIELWKKLYGGAGIEARFVSLGTEERGYELGMQGGRIFGYTEKNWWSRAGAPGKMPEGEPGGPDSEIFYDFGSAHDPVWGAHCHPNCDCGRFMEIGNSVFMEYVKRTSGFEKLAKQNVDFGGGLERIAAAANNNPDVFRLEVFDAARSVLAERSGKQYADAAYTRSFRIILDHMRAAAFFIASGIRPANAEQGYVLRRLIRRALREADKLGVKDAVLADVAHGYGEVYAEAYPFVLASATTIREELEKEEAQFRKTLAQGMREFEKMGAAVDAFTLFTTYGFPVELTAEIAQERGITLDLAAVEQKMQEHQALSRAGAAQKFAGGLADHAEQTVRYHTAHHLLLKALQMVLGPEVHQRGSNITSERLRIDFSYGAKMTDEQKTEVEKIVNEKIAEALPVIRTDMPKSEAEKLGAEHEFGATYPDTVSVYSVGALDSAFSIEFCGGPHVQNTSELGEGGPSTPLGTRKKFKIIKEEASSAGIRRIKAVLE